VICAAFDCPPDVAERQDWPKVEAILEYRTAEAAVALVNQGGEALKALGANPAMGNLLVELHAAQDLELVDYVERVRRLRGSGGGQAPALPAEASPGSPTTKEPDAEASPESPTMEEPAEGNPADG